MASTDQYRWVAHYEDGSQLPEIEADGAEHGFAQIDLGRLAAFELLPFDPSVPSVPSVTLRVDRADGSRPIFFRRRTVTVSATGEHIGSSTITVIGWQRTVGCRSVTAFTYIFPDGSILVADRDDL